MSDKEATYTNPSIRRFVTKESINALDKKLQNLEIIITNLI